MFPKHQALVVMYHYVRESRDQSSGGIRPIFTDEFEQQLDWLEDNFRVVTPQEFLFDLRTGLKPSGKAPCLLTFDDGTRDQLQIAAPILQRRSLSGVFFILTWPSEQQRMPVAHALHWILGQPEDQVWAKLKIFAETYCGGIGALGSAEDAIQIYYYESELRALIKYAVNFALPTEAAEKAVEAIAQDLGTPLTKLAEQWFMSEQDIKHLDTRGMEIGMHGCSHRSLMQLGAEGMPEEITYSSSYLENLLGKPPTWLACPFGGAGLDQDMDGIYQASRKSKVEAIVTSRKAFVTSGTDPYDIPRYDCIYLPPRSDEQLRDQA